MMAEAGSIWTAYIGYLIFRALYQMMITVARYKVAHVQKVKLQKVELQKVEWQKVEQSKGRTIKR